MSTGQQACRPASRMPEGQMAGAAERMPHPMCAAAQACAVTTQKCLFIQELLPCPQRRARTTNGTMSIIIQHAPHPPYQALRAHPVVQVHIANNHGIGRHPGVGRHGGHPQAKVDQLPLPAAALQQPRGGGLGERRRRRRRAALPPSCPGTHDRSQFTCCTPPLPDARAPRCWRSW